MAHSTPTSGHLGVDKTYKRLTALYYWPGVYRDVAIFVRACATCQQTKVEQNTPADLMGRRVLEQPWQMLAADCMGPYPKSKGVHAYIVVFRDFFSKWTECVPLRKANAKTIRRALEDTVVYRWGTPEIFFIDNATEFVNREMVNAASELGIRHTTTPPYHTQPNPVERANRMTKTMIASFTQAH